MIGWLPARARWRWLLLVPIAGLAALIEAGGALAVFGLLRLVVDPELVRTTPVVVAVAAVLAVVIVPIVLTRRAWETIGESERALYQVQLQLLQQSLGAIKDVKVTGRQPFFEERFRDARRELGATKQRRVVSATVARLSVEATLILSMLILIFLIMRAGVPTAHIVSVLALFAYTGFRVVPSANRIMLNVGYMREAHPWVRGMDEDMRRLKAPAPRPFEPAPPMLQSTLACEDVSFRYDDAPGPALANVSFTIVRGQSVGIVGPTGAGKSTLVDVLLGLLPPTSGCVLVDGQPLEGRERAWQRQIGYVSQDVFLLDDSLRRNIAFGIPDGAVDDQRLASAVSQARLDEVVAGLPNRLETVIGEDGVRLSGGQRQRVAIARALYHDPPVLVFDEATAALDSQTEREVTEAIASVRGTRTVIAIAHRLSTVKACDQLIYLADGRLAGLGTYDELMRDPGFRQLT